MVSAMADNSSETNDLLRRVADGDAEGWGALLARHEERLRRGPLDAEALDRAQRGGEALRRRNPLAAGRIIAPGVEHGTGRQHAGERANDGHAENENPTDRHKIMLLLVDDAHRGPTRRNRPSSARTAGHAAAKALIDD